MSPVFVVGCCRDGENSGDNVGVAKDDTATENDNAGDNQDDNDDTNGGRTNPLLAAILHAAIDAASLARASTLFSDAPPPR